MLGPINNLATKIVDSSIYAHGILPSDLMALLSWSGLTDINNLRAIVIRPNRPPAVRMKTTHLKIRPKYIFELEAMRFTSWRYSKEPVFRQIASTPLRCCAS
jgi:hypothetical protein